MRVTLLRLAESVSTRPLNLREASASLYPPIPYAQNPFAKDLAQALFRRILRAHRHLPLTMRSLGDAYVKSEYRRHHKITNPVHVIGFLSQWKVYLDGLPQGEEAKGFKGKRLDPTVFEKMSGEQLGQLYELMHASKDVWKPIPEDSES